VLPPMPEDLKAQKENTKESTKERPKARKEARKQDRKQDRPADRQESGEPEAEPHPRKTRTPRLQATRIDRPSPRVAASSSQRRSIRKARLRLVQVDAWSVMKTAFLLSIALGIILVVAVAVVWSVLGAAGVWDSINSMVQQTLGSDNSTPFRIQDYVGTSRVLGFAMIVAVVDVILITAIATLGAFVYNLAATLVGGVEVTLAEDL
jgi:hypothetical protein